MFHKPETSMGKLWAKDPNFAKAIIGAAIQDNLDDHHVGFSFGAEEQAFIRRTLRDAKAKAKIRKNQDRYVGVYNFWQD